MQHYSDVDAQLLLEVRIALIQGKPLPVSLVRVLAARGWAAQPTEVIQVRAALEDEPETTIEAYSQSLAVPQLTPVGKRELALHARIFEDELLEDMVDEDEVDEWDEEDDDEGDEWKG